jgi:hypothetical protein
MVLRRFRRVTSRQRPWWLPMRCQVPTRRNPARWWSPGGGPAEYLSGDGHGHMPVQGQFRLVEGVPVGGRGLGQEAEEEPLVQVPQKEQGVHQLPMNSPQRRDRS